MLDKIKSKFIDKIKILNNKDGMGTIEIIFIIAVLLSLAILFGVSMKSFVNARLDQLTSDDTFEKVDPNNAKREKNAPEKKDGSSSGNRPYKHTDMEEGESISIEEISIEFIANKAIVTITNEV